MLCRNAILHILPFKTDNNQNRRRKKLKCKKKKRAGEQSINSTSGYAACAHTERSTRTHVFYSISSANGQKIKFLHSFRYTRIGAEYRTREKQNGMHCKESVWVTRNALTQTGSAVIHIRSRNKWTRVKNRNHMRPSHPAHRVNFGTVWKLYWFLLFRLFFFVRLRGWCATACWNG